MAKVWRIEYFVQQKDCTSDVSEDHMDGLWDCMVDYLAENGLCMGGVAEPLDGDDDVG